MTDSAGAHVDGRRSRRRTGAGGRIRVALCGRDRTLSNETVERASAQIMDAPAALNEVRERGARKRDRLNASAERFVAARSFSRDLADELRYAILPSLYPPGQLKWSFRPAVNLPRLPDYQGELVGRLVDTSSENRDR